MTSLGQIRVRIGAQLRRVRTDASGQIAILFGLSVTAIVMAAGGGIDLARAYQAKQKLSEVATLACQYASRPSVVSTIAPTYSGSNGSATYLNNVTSYITKTLANQQFAPLQQTTANPFTFTPSGPADVTLTASVPTAFMAIARITQVPVSATAHCYDNPSNLPQIVPEGSTVPNGNEANLVNEGFENTACSGTCYAFYSPTGSVGTRSTSSSTFPASPGYTGASGNTWYIMGYCVEIDSVGVIKSSVPEGFHSAELDCDNGSGSAGNSSISTKVYMQAGNYELRYNYVSRVDYPNYDPIYICGSSASDVAWATDSNAAVWWNPVKTNQINVYLDLSTNGQPGTHTTLDGTQTLAGGNLIDSCVYAQNWVERSVRIYVQTAGYYWLSFAADGQNDSYGGQIDNIRLCPATCATTLADSFPTAWLPSSGVNKVLFEDTFESPTYTQDYPYHWITKGGNLNVSYGTTGTAASGWPSQAQSGWAVAPYNQVNYGLNGAAQGSQHILLDGYNANGTTNRNRVVSRSFYLVPGYYKLDYSYISIVDFSQVGAYGTFCWNMPSSGFLFGPQGPATGTIRYYNTTATDGTTNAVGAFMSHGQLVSTPIGGGALNSATSYTNPNAPISTTPTVPPDKVNYAAYDATAVNPLLDACGYADSYRWVPRTAYMKITKPAPYWLTFSANGGTSDGNGGGIDDPKLTALGSLYMSSPPTTSVTIPVPDPQPGSRTYFLGFYIVADPLLAPAALQ